MPARPARVHPSASPADEVDAFLATIEHPHKAEILTLREIILGADPAVEEGVKWNAPSYRTADWFATTNLRARTGVQIVMHFGARKRAGFAPPATAPARRGRRRTAARSRFATWTTSRRSDPPLLP